MRQLLLLLLFSLFFQLCAEPILIITFNKNPSSQFYGEILKVEGLNAFKMQDISTIKPATLKEYDLALLSEMPLQDDQVKMFTDWVTEGGKLIVMRPDKKLAPLLGLEDAKGTLSDGYLLIDTSSPPGKGIVGETIQFHKAADRYLIKDAKKIATLYQNATVATNNPAVTLRNVGKKSGQVAAFTYDLAKSIIATRQGNIKWVNHKRNGEFRESVDFFFPDYVNLDKVAIPQADEQQRLLANMILLMNLSNKPLPKFWYLPSGRKAVILHAIDDHANVGDATKITFNKLKANSPPNCSVEDWECYRGTSWFFLGIPLNDKEAKAYNDEGFEMGLHISTKCRDWNPQTLEALVWYGLKKFRETYPSLPPQKTSRTHCVVMTDWSTGPKVEYKNGILLDANYYYWPGEWIKNRPGFLTGSGFPMPYTDTDGSIIPVYQACTQLPNESEMEYPEAILAMIDKALGPEGYYGVFTTHDDYTNPQFLEDVIESAKSRGIAIVSALQVLNWFEGKNNSSFENISWKDETLSFKVNSNPKARNLQVMVPTQSLKGTLAKITLDDRPIEYKEEMIKGISYALFLAQKGTFQFTYSPQTRS